MPDAALEPDVEEVGELGVLDVVVVGRVNGDVVNAAICDSCVRFDGRPL